MVWKPMTKCLVEAFEAMKMHFSFLVEIWLSQANTWTFWMTQLLEQQLSTQLAGTPYVVQAVLFGKVKKHRQALAFLLCGWSTFPANCVAASSCFKIHFSKLWQCYRPQNAKNPTKQSEHFENTTAELHLWFIRFTRPLFASKYMKGKRAWSDTHTYTYID